MKINNKLEAFKKLAKENIELRNAVKKSTAELENKNRELEIESSLERVRAVAMGMNKPEDMLKVCKAISMELQSLGVKDIRNIQTAVFYEGNGTYMNYEYYAKHKKTIITETSYTNHKIHKAFAARMLQGKGESFSTHIKGKKVKDWIAYQKTTNVFIDRFLQTASSINYYWYSLGPVALGMSTYAPLSTETLGLFNRFRNVFELTYRRFSDIELAMAQAKEAQIEASLERVRAQALGMYKPNDLPGICEVLFKELQNLGFVELRNTMINIFDDDKGSFLNYDYSANAGQTITPLPYNTHPIIDKQVQQARTSADAFSEAVFAGKDLEKWKAFRKKAGEKEDPKVNKIDSLFYYFYSIGTGVIGISTYSSITDEKRNLLKRFRNVFDFAYRRYMDVAQAEIQAREAQIELALERVRARTMAMQHSEELQEAAKLLFQQVKALGLPVLTCGYNIWEKEEKICTAWMSSEDGFILPSFKIPLTKSPFTIRFYESRQKGESFYAEEVAGEALAANYKYLLTLPGFAEIIDGFLKSGFTLPGFQVNHVANFSHGNIIFVTYKPVPESWDIFKRFTAVFDQTYTRFLDLQKAEAQAREAQIEAALERVRSRSMGMQKSEELKEIIRVVYEQFVHLNILVEHAGFIMDYKASADMNIWLADRHDIPSRLSIPYFDSPHWNSFNEAKEKGLDFFANYLDHEEKNRFYKELFKLFPGVGDQAKEYYFAAPGLAVSTVLLDSVGLYIENFSGIPYTEEENNTLMRFGKVFQQTYTRFSDLQKAEAQSREAQIELSLERVRAKTMAMHNSGHVGETAAVMVEELKKLGIETIRCGIGIMHEPGDMELWTIRSNDNDKSDIIIGRIDMNIHPLLHGAFESWRNKNECFYYELKGDDVLNYFTAVNNYPGYPIRYDTSSLPAHIHHNEFYFPEGILFAFSLEQLADEQKKIFKRFAAVFGQTYRRYLDLQKAEAQVKEAQVEAALEKVRSKTMAMHSSDDVGDTVATMFNEFVRLGIQTNRCGILIFGAEYAAEVWTAQSNPDGKANLIIGKLNLTVHPLLLGIYNAWKKKEAFNAYKLNGVDLKNYYQSLNDLEYYPVKFNMNALPSKEFHSDFYFPEGCVFTFSAEPIQDESSRVIKKFAAVFGQTYRRYLDLKKAEAQAREAKIEAAMEKVRSRAMAMQKPNELVEVAQLLRREMNILGVEELETSSIYIHHEDMQQTECWYAIKDVTHPEKEPVSDHMTIDLTKTWVGKEMLAFYHSGKKKISIAMRGDNRKEWINYCTAHSKVLEGFYGDIIPDRVYHLYKFSHGYMGAASPGDISAESWDLLQRATSVFSLAYTRFNDLQQAEAQAREATIEAALEKVRGKAMAMHNSNDLSVTASMVFTELRKLNINPIRCGVGLLNKESCKAQLYSATSSLNGDSLSLVGWVDLEKHPVLEKIYDSWVLHEDYFPELQGEQLSSYYHLLLSGLAVAVPDTSNDQKQYGHFIPISVGCLYAWSDMPYNEAEIKILKRFASIIDLTFRRYIELQKSEANARDAVRQASLDRVRAEIASMRTTNDLERITPLIWNELIILGIPFMRCGVFLMDDAQQLIHTFLSSPEGKAIAAFHIPYTTPGNIGQVLHHWQQKENYIDHWDESSFKTFADTLVKQGALVSADQYLQSIPHGGFYLHFLPFLQGMLYVGNSTRLKDEEIHLIQSVAGAFSTAYARYEDFNKLEAAKQTVEKTLTDLKQTQQQLLQSEKMASLGELTAGIAHEIQNPLNFVNNFSEVSRELMDELKSQKSKLKPEEQDEILNDIDTNLEKILHHGKRADAIVKGMLQHSRATSAIKEPTDINKLADEYLRLAYHGLRAKDKSFNATLKTDYDDSIGNINIIPQDIGRVILNLITNAFYAVTEKKKQLGDDYEPLVTISTRSLPVGEGWGGVEIKVSDNGGGIDASIISKIFQPFFTTKPTGQGTGLGLSLAYDIVKAHGGDLSVKTTAGQGSEFILSLPA